MSASNKKEGIFSKMSDKTLNIIVIASIAVVILATVACVLFQNGFFGASASGSASGAASGDSVQVSASDEETATTTGQNVIALPVADGDYTCAATGNVLSVSNTGASGFAFVLRLANGASFAETAAFDPSYEYAVYTEGATSIRFTLGTGSVTIGLSGTASALGLPGESVLDGTYVASAPTTTTTTTTTTAATTTTTAATTTTGVTTTADSSGPNTALDVGFKDSAATQATLKTLMGSDYDLMNSIFSSGSEQISKSYPDVTYDKNGVMCRTDVDLNAVKYEYVTNNGSGERVLLLCTQSGKVYVGICDGSEFRYYTNDDAYKSSAPECIVGTANSLSMKLSYK